MDIYNTLKKQFSFETMSIEELMEISSFIDAGKSNPDSLVGNDENAAQIASVIVALMNEISTTTVGNKLYADINDLIVSRNLSIANAKSGKELYEKLSHEQNIGKYTIHRHGQGYSFVLNGPSGDVLAFSELYSKAESCINGIEALRKNSHGEVEDQTKENYSKVTHPKFEVYIDKSGEFRFRIKSRNGEIIAVSEGFKNKQSCQKTIDEVKRNAISDIIEKA